MSKDAAQKTEKKRFAREFREFIDRGGVVEVGVAFIMGATFKTVIDAFAGDGKDNQGILGGILGAIFGGQTPNFNDKGAHRFLQLLDGVFRDVSHHSHLQPLSQH